MLIVSMRNPLGNPIRDIGYVAWKDEYAPLEHMKGALWKKAIASETRAYKSVADLPDVVRQAKKNADQLRAGWRTFDRDVFEAGGGMVKITPDNEWAWTGEAISTRRRFEDLDADGEYVWEIRDLTDEADNYGALKDRSELGLYKRDSAKPIWTRRGVGSEVAVCDGRCYYTLVKNLHRAYVVESCNALTGTDRRQHMHEDAETINLTLLKAPCGALYVSADDSGKTALYEIPGGAAAKAKLVDKSSHSQNPVGPGAWIALEADGTAKGRGKVRGWPLPKDAEPVWGDYMRGFLLAYKFGSTQLYGWGPSTLEPLVQTEIGIFDADPWTAWHKGSAARFFISPLTAEPYILTIDKLAQSMTTSTLYQTPTTATLTPIPPLIVYRQEAISRDGTHVPYHMIGLTCEKPKGLLVYGYGAYGSTTHARKIWPLWAPLLEAGWVLAYAYVRGGGDGGEPWAEAGRRLGRLRAVEDFEAVIRAAQKVAEVPPQRTVISGRSAGGVLVGTTVARHRDGDLMGAAFAEVPYLDVLRTTTNPTLPLTTIEYNEFGNPRERLEDLMSVMRVSPVDLAAGRGAPGVFVLSRAGGKDTQVLAYEPLKWTLRLREGGAGEGKLFAYEADEGHFYGREADITARATDLAILMTRLDKPRVREKIAHIDIQMARSTRSATRKVSGGRRRRASVRKSKKNMRKSRKVNMRKSRKGNVMRK